ncbi:hypothetical protein DFP72DRAFT_893274 [Ephemerocybe angulata]|uniref:Transcription factor TFIIIC triple barrel domain-containing protein n=1 Tax=Ephemerocybe angulata TaxID=980116 RepID=A0A8H6HLE4_9AGAR|nr:hypothetical protein DFP72DRAFT_549449 [Tulosesus angulatus]KAF6756629.1 hypothetical protein DFP72DRAFT_893274 [Tulosesus angulatus]
MASEVPTSLLPGYQQIEEFGPDDEYEGEEEISYITLDLGNVEPTLVPSASGYHLIGLDTPTPFLQLQGTVFKGHHHHLLGTEMVFSEDRELQKRTVQHVANTEQRIIFKEVTLQPKSPSASPDRQEKPSEATEPSTTSESTAQGAVLDADGQRIDRMTGKAAPPTRAPRAKGTAKKKQSEPEDSSLTESRKGKEKADPDSDPMAAPSDADGTYEMDTT